MLYARSYSKCCGYSTEKKTKSCQSVSYVPAEEIHNREACMCGVGNIMHGNGTETSRQDVDGSDKEDAFVGSPLSRDIKLSL